MLLMSWIFKLKGIFSGLFGLVCLILGLRRLESWEVEICLSINTRNFVNKLIILYSTGVCFVEKHGREIGTLSILFGYQIKWFWSDLYEKNFLFNQSGSFGLVVEGCWSFLCNDNKHNGGNKIFSLMHVLFCCFRICLCFAYFQGKREKSLLGLLCFDDGLLIR